MRCCDAGHRSGDALRAVYEDRPLQFTRRRTLRSGRWRGLRTRIALILLHLQQRRPDLRFWHQHVIEGYIVDFVLPKYNLVLEIDGPHHRERRDYDKHRTRVLEKKGFKVLRLYSSYCYSEQGRDKLLQLVEKTCQALSSVCNQPLESEPAG